MTFTKTSPKFGQWSDHRANTVYGLGFAAENDLVQVTMTVLVTHWWFHPLTHTYKVSNKASRPNDIVGPPNHICTSILLAGHMFMITYYEGFLSCSLLISLQRLRMHWERWSWNGNVRPNRLHQRQHVLKRPQLRNPCQLFPVPRPTPATAMPAITKILD